jgi:hypothetical protein
VERFFTAAERRLTWAASAGRRESAVRQRNGTDVGGVVDDHVSELIGNIVDLDPVEIGLVEDFEVAHAGDVGTNLAGVKPDPLDPYPPPAESRFLRMQFAKATSNEGKLF